jgi:hypothetical protein
MSVGKTRPELPTKVSMPSSRRQVSRLLRPEVFQQRAQPGRRLGKAADEGLEGLGMGQVQPALASQQELAAHRGHAVEEMHRAPRARQHFRGRQPGGAGADHGDVKGAVGWNGDGHAGIVAAGPGPADGRRGQDSSRM